MSATTWLADGLKGRHVLLALFGFFGLIFVVNGIFVYYALSTFGGGETTDPYRKGLNYNETIAEAARQDQQGWRAQVIYAAAAGRLAFNLTDSEGRPVSGLHFTGTLSRPVTDREDTRVTFKEAPSGTYTADVRLAPGQWVVELSSEELSRDGAPSYRLKQRLFVAEKP
jgi:nitrogen fixation protein FixH